jgi:hypothetical protein
VRARAGAAVELHHLCNRQRIDVSAGAVDWSGSKQRVDHRFLGRLDRGFE